MDGKPLVPKDSEVLLTFIEKAKNGDYSTIEKSSMPYVRLKETDRSSEFLEEDYTYNMS